MPEGSGDQDIAAIRAGNRGMLMQRALGKTRYFVRSPLELLPERIPLGHRRLWRCRQECARGDGILARGSVLACAMARKWPRLAAMAIIMAISKAKGTVSK